MIHNFYLLVNGSSLSLPAHGWVGARATSFSAAHFALRNAASSASEKSESGKERAGRNSPQTPPFFPPRPKNKIGVAKRFRRLGIKTSKQNNFQFLLRKIWRAGDKKLKENCFALMFGLTPNGGNASLRLGRGGIPPPNPLLPPRPRSDCSFFRRNWRPCQFHWRAASFLN